MDEAESPAAPEKQGMSTGWSHRAKSSIVKLKHFFSRQY